MSQDPTDSTPIAAVRPNWAPIARRVAAAYGVAGFLWILTSDLVLMGLRGTRWEAVRWEVLKGGLFVAVTTVILFWMLRGLLERIEKARLAQAALLEREHTYREMFNATNEAIFIEDAVSGRILEANEAALRMYGYSQQSEIRARSIDDLCANEPDFPNEVARKRIRQAMADGPQIYEWRARKKNGDHFWVELSLRSSLIGGQGRILAVVRDISPRKQAEQALRKSEQKYRRLHESMTDAFGSVDMDGRIQETNAAFRALVGYSEEELSQLTYRDLTPVKWHDFEERMVREQLVATGQAAPFEKEYRRKDGTVFPVEVRSSIVRDDSGLPVAMWAIVRDISRRKQAEKELRESEVRFRSLFRSNPNPMWVYDVDSLAFVEVNDAAVSHYGYSREEYLTMTLRDICPAEDLPAGRPASSCTSGQVELWRHRLKDGSTILAEVLSQPLEAAGASLRVMTAHDVTEQQAAQAALASSEARYRLLAENMTDVVWCLDLETLRCTYVSPSVIPLRGFTPEELMAQPVETMLTSESVATVKGWQTLGLRQLAHERTANSRELYELAELRKDGSVVWTEVSLSVLHDSRGGPVQLLAVSRDITERRRVGEALRKSEEKYRLLVDNALEAIYVVQDGVICFANETACRNFDPGQSDVVGRVLWQFMPAEDRAAATEWYQRLMSGEVEEQLGDFRLLTAPDEPQWYSVNSVRIQWKGRAASLNFATNVTARKRAEKALHDLAGQVLRMQDQERRRIARELHDTTVQRLAALGMNLAVLERDLPAMGAEGRELLGECHRLVDQSVRELRTLSYLLHPPLLDEFGLSKAVRDFATGFAQRSGLSVGLDLPANLGRLAPELELALFRVLQECLANALRHSGSRSVTVRLALDTDRLSLEVRDFGRGLPPALLKAATRGHALPGGIGVGIASMRERLQHLGGRLDLEPVLPGTLVRATIAI